MLTVGFIFGIILAIVYIRINGLKEFGMFSLNWGIAIFLFGVAGIGIAKYLQNKRL